MTGGTRSGCLFESTFQSTLPLRGVTLSPLISLVRVRFQSTLPLRGVTSRGNPSMFIPVISIHTPLAGSDAMSWVTPWRDSISIHTPLAGSDHSSVTGSMLKNLFQSTLPLRGVTIVAKVIMFNLLFQSTLPLRGVTDLPHGAVEIPNISIHTPLAGSDLPAPLSPYPRR